MSEQTQSEIFDLNDPNLVLDLPEGYDPEADLQGGFAPPPFGQVRVQLTLREATERKPSPVYFKNGAIIAAVAVRLVKPDGELGQYLKDFYPTSRVFEGQATSKLAQMCKLAGSPLPRTTSPGEIQKHVLATFEKAGEAGIQLTAKVDWVKPQPLHDENGEFAGWGEDLKGRKAISESAIQQAHHLAVAEGKNEDEVNAAIAYAQANPHLYADPVTGEERSVRSEIKYLVGA